MGPTGRDDSLMYGAHAIGDADTAVRYLLSTCELADVSRPLGNASLEAVHFKYVQTARQVRSPDHTDV